MRILHVIPGLAVSSGPTSALLNLAREQARLGHEVAIAHVTGRGTDARPESGLPVLGFPAVLLPYWAYSPGLRRWLGAHVAGFDVVHIHSLWLYPNLAAEAACARRGVPYWVRPAGSLEPWCFGPRAWKKRLYFRCLERPGMNRAAAVHAVSEQEAANIRATGIRAPIVTIPNGVDLAAFDGGPDCETARTRLGLPREAPIVLFLGRIHPKKGLDLLGAAFAGVRRRFPEAVLAVVGPDDGPFARQVRNDYAALGLGDSVRFLGERRDREKVAAFRAADVFVLPSHSENFGIAVAESLAAGTPVVVSRNTPWQAVETEGAGFWIDLEPGRIEAALGEILSNPDRARIMGARGRALVEREFQWPAIASRVLAEYERTTAASRQTGVEALSVQGR